MIPWYTLATAQMANNLIKWWRTKFLNGYKKFSVIQSDDNDESRSDTDELLADCVDSEHLLLGSRILPGHDPFKHGFDVTDATLPTCSTPPAIHITASVPTPIPAPTPMPTPTFTASQTQIPPTTSLPAEDKEQNNQLHLEEFSCDVSMEGGISCDGQERQEFSFTLYDFDGHGKITKDDIAGLVTTIYETLGNSVKVPHYGSKTIKVKLTVSPDQRKRMSATATLIDHKSTEQSNKNNNSNSGNVKAKDNTDCRMKRDLNVTIKDSNNSSSQHQHQQRQHRRHCKQYKPKVKQQQQHTCCHFACKERENENASNVNANISVDASDDEQEYSDQCSQILEDEFSEDEGECSEDQMPKHPSCEKVRSKRYQKYASPWHQTHIKANLSSSNLCNPASPVLCTKAKRSKKRSSSLQRKELLEIIQANMDKNNHGFQTVSRKQCPNHVNIENKEIHIPSVERKEHRYKHKASRESAAQLQCLANIVNSDSCYLDLSTLQGGNTQLSLDEENCLKNVPYCRYDKLLGAVVCVSNKQINGNLLQRSPFGGHAQCRNKKHSRSKSLELPEVPIRYHLLKPHLNNLNKYNHFKNEITDNCSPRTTKKTNARLKSYEAEFEQTPAAFKKNIKKFPQVVLGHSSSPHHLKHRNRQEDQARAMAQVVRWLEQEFSSNVNMNLNNKSETTNNKTKRTTKSSTCHASHQHQHQSPRSSSNQEAASPTVSTATVERHEHHHVHEHIHHHYHHYQETPVVV